MSQQDSPVTEIPAADESQRVEQAAAQSGKRRKFQLGAAGRNIGLVVAFMLLCAVGVITGGERFASLDNVMVILSLGAIIGVVSIGMTFVITTGGIDLSVGSVLGLATVWSTTLATQTMADQYGWIVIVGSALAVGLVAGLVNGVIISYGNVVAFIATLAMLVGARGLAEMIANRRTQILDVRSFGDVFKGNVLGVPKIAWIFVIVAIIGWFLMNRTTFGRRTVAVGGNAEAARLAGINVKRHLMMVYALAGLLVGVAAVMMLARTGVGSSNHGNMYELDAIAAVVVGGTLLAGGRGSIFGTVLGVLIFTTLNNVFIINGLDSSVQAVAKGAIIIIAVLMQQRFANGKNKT